jgi:steroid delta-isomerase-like uncharacterized protein
MENQNEQLTCKLHETFSNDQFDQTLQLASDDVEVHAYAFGQTFKNKEGFANFMQGFKTAFPDIKIQHKTIVSSGNHVAVEFTAQGTHTGPLQTPSGAIPPTGKPVTITVSEFMKWENGKLMSLHNYQDAGSIMRQIGVL